MNEIFKILNFLENFQCIETIGPAGWQHFGHWPPAGQARVFMCVRGQISVKCVWGHVWHTPRGVHRCLSAEFPVESAAKSLLIIQDGAAAAAAPSEGAPGKCLVWI